MAGGQSEDSCYTAAMSINPTVAAIAIVIVVVTIFLVWQRMHPSHCPHRGRGNCDECKSFLQTW